MAKLKSEVWQKKYDEKGTTLRERFIRNSTEMASKFSGALSGAVNGIQKTKLFRTALEKLAGIEKERILPAYAAQPFYKWFAKMGVIFNPIAQL